MAMTNSLRKTGSALLLGLVASLLVASPVYAGNIFLTGHDVLYHNGQEGLDAVILDYLRGAGTVNEISKADYDIAVVGSGIGSAQFTGGSGFTHLASGDPIPLVGTLADYASATYFRTGTGLDWSDILSRDVLIILSHTSCGGCDLSDAGSDEINAQSSAIGAAFAAGMDIWANSGADSPTYYNFLPPNAVATGLPIAGSTGFVATPEGVAIGIEPDMINGHPTHNRFVDASAAFTVFEVRPFDGADEIISVGAVDVTFADIGGSGAAVAAPVTGLFGLALMASILFLYGWMTCLGWACLGSD